MRVRTSAEAAAATAPMLEPRRVLGIDPGSRLTGYGIVDVGPRRGTHGHVAYLASGCIRAQGQALPDRLGDIYRGVEGLIRRYQPHEFAIENVFLARNAQSALKLGQARGVAIAAAVAAGLPIYEYAARQVKLAVVGTGRANKEQVQHMVQVLLELTGKPQTDAADALAIAVCHVNTAPHTGGNPSMQPRTKRV